MDVLQGLRWTRAPASEHMFPRLRLQKKAHLVSLAGGEQSPVVFMLRMNICDGWAEPAQSTPPRVLSAEGGHCGSSVALTQNSGVPAALRTSCKCGLSSSSHSRPVQQNGPELSHNPQNHSYS